MNQWKPMVMVGTYRKHERSIRGYAPCAYYCGIRVDPTANVMFLSTFDKNIEQCLTMRVYLEEYLSK